MPFCIRMDPLSPHLRAEEVLPTLRFSHGRQVCGVAFITAAHTPPRHEAPIQIGPTASEAGQQACAGNCGPRVLAVQLAPSLMRTLVGTRTYRTALAARSVECTLQVLMA